MSQILHVLYFYLAKLHRKLIRFSKKKKNVFGVFILSAIYKANIQVHDTMKKKN